MQVKSRSRNLRIIKKPKFKANWVYVVNKLLSEVKNVNIYVEPEYSNASVLLNLKTEFLKRVINDESSSVIKILRCFRDKEYEQLVQLHGNNEIVDTNIITPDNVATMKVTLLDTIMYSQDYNSVVDIYDDENVVFLFGPRHNDRESFIDMIMSLKGKVIYSDEYNYDTIKKLDTDTIKKWGHTLILSNNKKIKKDCYETIYVNF